MKNKLYLSIMYKWSYLHCNKFLIISLIFLFFTITAPFNTLAGLISVCAFILFYAMACLGATIRGIEKYNKDKELEFIEYEKLKVK